MGGKGWRDPEEEASTTLYIKGTLGDHLMLMKVQKLKCLEVNLNLERPMIFHQGIEKLLISYNRLWGEKKVSTIQAALNKCFMQRNQTLILNLSTD